MLDEFDASLDIINIHKVVTFKRLYGRLAVNKNGDLACCKRKLQGQVARVKKDLTNVCC